MDTIKGITKAVFVLTAFFVTWAISSALSPLFGAMIGGVGLALSAVVAFYPLPSIWLNARPTAILLGLLSLVAMTASYSVLSESSLQKLKTTDPNQYLAELKRTKPDSLYMRELELLNADEYKKEVERRAEHAKAVDLERAEREKRAAAERAEKARIEALERARRRPELQMELSGLSWGKDGFGTVMTLSFTVSNKNAFDVKDFTIKCTHTGPSGTVIDSNTRTLFEVVKAGSRRSFRNFNMGFIHSQSARTSCEVTGAIAQ